MAVKPVNGTTYSLTQTAVNTSQAVKPGATSISVPPGILPLFGTSNLYSATGSINPKPAVVDPVLGTGNAVTQTGSTTPLFANNYLTSKVPNPISVTYSPLIAVQTSTATKNITTVIDKLVQSNNETFVQPANLNDYTFNLSPHSWSLPIAPHTVDNRRFNKPGSGVGATKANVVGSNPNPASKPNHRLRRGRITWHASAQDLQYTTGNGGSTGVAGGKARQMGFQFLWNPENFATQVVLNTDVTPSMQDRFVGVAGAFPGTETISLTVHIDRTNDFACFAHKGTKERDPKSKTGGDRDKQWNANYGKFYKPHKLGVATDALLDKQIAELYQLGTLADIEFLYQTVNGPNANYMQGGWKNSLGRVTSDIGFLSATLVKFEIGPLNYLGYINAISVQHLAFTQDMKPIRSDVTIQANLLASVGLAEAK